MNVSCARTSTSVWPRLTSHLILKGCELGVCITDDVVEGSAQLSIAAGEDFATMTLPGPLNTVSLEAARRHVSRRVGQGDEQILCHLIRPEAQCTPRTFHDSLWAQTAKDTCLVVLTGVEAGDHGIVRSRQLCLASWTCSVFRGTPVETRAAGAVNTEDMTVGFSRLSNNDPCTWMQGRANTCRLSPGPAHAAPRDT